SGPMIVLNAAGEEIDRTPQASFCRCGQTAKAPYCDGSHKKAGFTAP
ncbi:MAG: CDGSH iron-sulfur domain-containing protein, partial [Roseomonas sp.]|nr:CDGSH iron-sulfur domain-containing protein [Roseomonas sp.]